MGSAAWRSGPERRSTCAAATTGGWPPTFPRSSRRSARWRSLRWPWTAELVAATSEGLDFGALLSRVHPAASRVERLRRETPACFIAFDALAIGERDLRAEPYSLRRAALERLLGGSTSSVMLTPATTDPAIARRWLSEFQGRGIDGVVAKARGLRYQPGRRAMLKVKPLRTAECVVGGFRLLADRPAMGSLLLGLYDGGALRHVGVLSVLTQARRAAFLADLAPLEVPLQGHPWALGFGLGRNPAGRLAGSAGHWDPREMGLDWIPVRPERVIEISYDQLYEGRLRHPGQFVRWRPDRTAESCGFEQLAAAPHPSG